MSQSVVLCVMKLFNHDCTCLVGDGRLGYPNRGPYDAIHVGAAAKEMPQPVRKTLRIILGYAKTNALP